MKWRVNEWLRDCDERRSGCRIEGGLNAWKIRFLFVGLCGRRKTDPTKRNPVGLWKSGMFALSAR